MIKEHGEKFGIYKQLNYRYNMIQTHLALFNDPYYQLVLDKKKTKELRISKNQCPPYRKMCDNDIVYMKLVNCPLIEYKFVVKKVSFYHFLIVPDDTEDFLFKYRVELCLSDKFVRNKIGSKYATLIDIGEIIKLDQPIWFKKRDMRSWIMGFQNKTLISYV